MGFYIDMIGVGQGDAFLVTLDTPVGDVFFLIDGGPPDAGDTVADFVIQNAGGHLNAVIGTHLDLDHIGGLAKVIERCAIDYVYLNLPPDTRATLLGLILQRMRHQKTAKLWERVEKNLETGVALVEALTARRMNPLPLVAGESFALGNGDIRINVLNPTQVRLQDAWAEIEEEETPDKAVERLIGEKLAEKFGYEEAPETSAENNSSVVLEIVYKNLPYALLTADAGADVLREVTRGQQYRFLKVPHHGSKTGLDEGLIAQLRPTTAFVPVGPNNYGHPANEILDLLRKYGAGTYCSEKVNHCRQACPATGRRNICQPYDRASRPGWTTAYPCTN
jgi:beta-lactamase superfamily II metal-dependent hydrolase